MLVTTRIAGARAGSSHLVIEIEVHSEYLRVLIAQLRRKVEPVPSSPSYLITEPWVGYRFNPCE